jgi:2-hydroxycyclohexanecarboxyl-CoA dehydrogenase
VSGRLATRGVVLLGGTAGVGYETAAQFAEQGDRIALLGRNTDRGKAAVTSLLERVPGASVEFVRVDALNPDAVLAAEAECRAMLGDIDILMCSTGPSEPPRLLHDIPIQSIQHRLDEIVLPPLHLMHAALPAMRARGTGSIVIVASDAAKLATPGETLIGAAMAAIVLFCKAAALEVKREGVRINILTPSLIAGTPGAALIDGEPFSAKMFEKAAALAHLGVAESTDLAAMAVYLSSPAARRITGQAISINGGISVA